VDIEKIYMASWRIEQFSFATNTWVTKSEVLPLRQLVNKIVTMDYKVPLRLVSENYVETAIYTRGDINNSLKFHTWNAPTDKFDA